MTSGIQIDQLPPTSVPTDTHVVPAMKDGLTVKLTLKQIASLVASAAGVLPSTGGELTGDLVINEDDPWLTLDKANGSESGIRWSTNLSSRWELSCSPTGETGASAGSDLQLSAFKDDLTKLPILLIRRADGRITFGRDLNVAKTNPSLVLKKQATSGEGASVWGYTGENARWGISLGNAAPESGQSVGSDFGISRFDNAGTWLGDPFAINRSNGQIVTRGLNMLLNGLPGSPAFLRVNSPEIGQAALINGEKNGSAVWQMILGSAGAGGDFMIMPCDDAGLPGPGLPPFIIRRGNAQSPVVQLGVTSMQDQISSLGIDYSQPFYFHPSSYTGATYIQGVHHQGVEATLRIVIGGVICGFIDNSGNFNVATKGYQPGGGSWGSNSDARIKTVLGEYGSGLDAVKALQPVRYSYKGNDTTTPPSNVKAGEEAAAAERGAREAATAPYTNSPNYNAAQEAREFIGLVAQDVEAVMPEMVTKRAGFIDGQAVEDLRDLDTGPLLYALINSVKELSARLEVLEGGAVTSRKGKRDAG